MFHRPETHPALFIPYPSSFRSGNPPAPVLSSCAVMRFPVFSSRAATGAALCAALFIPYPSSFILSSSAAPQDAAAVATRLAAEKDAAARRAAAHADYPIRPAALTDVAVTGGFWGERFETNRKVTVAADFSKSEQTGRLSNFARAGRLEKGNFRGIPFDDSDVYKIIEGASYTLAQTPDPKLDAYLDALIYKIASAQELDGYLHTARTIGNLRHKMLGHARWANLTDGHELYNVGHLYEGAAAHYAATGKRALMHVALKNADLVCSVFGDKPGQILSVPGHQEIELGLVRLFRATGDAKYLRQAKFFVDARGRADLRKTYGAQFQDHKPLFQQDEAVGHAVRAGYFYAAATDIAALSGDPAYTVAVDKLWDNVTGKKLHLTGGIGARRRGEAFGANYELPNESAYLETCAAIANALWNHRLFLLHGDAKYLDVLERILHNGFLSGISLAGDEFFYPNPLASRGNYRRSKWFGCSCCPVNIVRFIPQIGQFAYASKEDVLYVNLFLNSTATLRTAAAGNVKIAQSTNYPWDGKIRLTITPEKHDADFTLKIRLPGWAQNRPVPSDLYAYVGSGEEVRLALSSSSGAVHSTTGDGSGAAAALSPCSPFPAPRSLLTPDGFLTIRRQWRAGDTVTLELPMPVRLVRAHDAVAADRGLLAVERGPLVYCAETADNPAPIYSLALDVRSTLSSSSGAVHSATGATGATGTTGTTTAPARILAHDFLQLRVPALAVAADRAGNRTTRPVTVTLIPYYAWCHRGAGQMRVWLPASPDAAEPQRDPAITTSHQPNDTADKLEAASDGIIPAAGSAGSADHSVKRTTWWPRRGTTEWLRYDFTRPRTVRSTAVYWFDDTGTGACAVPASWKIQYLEEPAAAATANAATAAGAIVLDGNAAYAAQQRAAGAGKWRDIPADAYPVAKDRLCRATFAAPVTARRFRLLVKLATGKSAGVLEWKLDEQ